MTTTIENRQSYKDDVVVISDILITPASVEDDYDYIVTCQVKINNSIPFDYRVITEHNGLEPRCNYDDEDRERLLKYVGRTAKGNVNSVVYRLIDSPIADHVWKHSQRHYTLGV